MRGPLATRINLTENQRCCLEKMVRRQKSEKRLVIRASIILAADEAMPNLKIAKQLSVDETTVRTWRNRFAQAAEHLCTVEAQPHAEKSLTEAITSVLMDKPRRGGVTTFTAEQIVQIVAISLCPPEESGRPIGCWSHRELADEAMKRDIVERISPRSVGRFLKSSGFKAASQPILAQS